MIRAASRSTHFSELNASSDLDLIFHAFKLLLFFPHSKIKKLLFWSLNLLIYRINNSFIILLFYYHFFHSGDNNH